MKSWDEIDAFRHWMYEDIWFTLKNYNFDNGGQNYLFEVGSREPTTPVINMMAQLAKERQQSWEFSAREYPFVDIHNLCFMNGELDMIIADQVLEHVAKPWIGANEMWRVLRQGGVAVCASPFLLHIHPNPDDYWRMSKSAYKVLFPEEKWTTLTLGQWGTKEIIQWAFNDKYVKGFAGNWIHIERAEEEIPGFMTEKDDGQFPLVVWWVGVKK
jgi:SAM-dependent methyltransferase